MPSYLIAFFAAAGAAAWVYDKTMQRTGGNIQNALTASAVIGIITFFLFLSLVSLVDSMLA